MNILSLDGGGVRGIITATWLRNMENTLGSPLVDEFDMIAGTSTGSIMALGLAAGIPANKMVELYLEHASTAFPTSATKRLFSRIKRTFTGQGLSVPRYDGLGLNEMLQTVFEDRLFEDVQTDVLIPTYEAEFRNPIMLKSWKKAYAKIPMWEVARASSSAPTYFPAHKVQINSTREAYLVDGGLVANNPATCAVAEALRMGHSIEDILLVSLGTGAAAEFKLKDPVDTWGPIQWAPHIISALMDGSSDVVNYHMEHMLKEDKYFRFQATLPSKYAVLDNAKKDNMRFLHKMAEQNIRSTGQRKKVRSMFHAIKENV